MPLSASRHFTATSHRRFAALLVLPLLALAGPTCAFEARTRWITITQPDSGKSERVLMTYPAKTDGEVYRLGANALWQGVPARREATPAKGKWPLVLLSHGSGGNAAGLGWVSTFLAKNGFVVASPNHAGCTSTDMAISNCIKIWNRPEDLSELLDVLLADDHWSKQIDEKRIAAMGFSLGGNSVLLMAGARMSLEAYQAYCQTMLSPQSDCTWLRRGGVDLATVDKSRFDKESRDPRISAFVAIDPGFAPGYRTDSLRTIIIPGLLLNLGVGSDVPVTLKADSLAAAIPQAEFASIAGAVHFSFLGLCNPNGAELLKAENDDPVCDDGGNLPRQALHQQMLQRIGLFLTKTLLER